MFDAVGLTCFAGDGISLKYILALLCSHFASDVAAFLNPTMSYTVGTIADIPFVYRDNDTIEVCTEENIRIAVSDWDSHETSWDFKENELIRILKSDLTPHLSINGEKQPDAEEISFILDQYKLVWANKFNQLHTNEEELNRQFIEIYGLQDELTPEVPLDEITILQQGEISIENNQIVWHDDVIIKQLLSYAIGCWMGRYRLDKEGLNIAHYPIPEEICTYDYNGDKFEIVNDPVTAAKNADAIYTDVWASMGQEGEAEKRKIAFAGYQVNDDVMAAAKPDAMVLHCLPAHRGEEITEKVFEAHADEIFEEAENRLHAQKAVMVLLMK